MKLVEVPVLPKEGYFVVAGINEDGIPFGLSIFTDGENYFEYDGYEDEWQRYPDQFYFLRWPVKKFYVVEK